MPISRKISSKGMIKQFTVLDNNFTTTGENYGAINSAYGYPNGSETPVNLTFSTVAGKTLVTLGWAYPLNVNAGLPYGSLDVYINGQIIPRYIAGSTAGAYYTEYSATAILLDQDYSTWTIDVEVVQRATVIDTNTQNTTAIAELISMQTNGFQGFVNTVPMLQATTTTGAPATGFFYSSIIGRSSIPDFTQDLKPRFGIERIMVQSISQIQSEQPPSGGGSVWTALNDSFNQIRFIGEGWTSPQSNEVGITAYSPIVNDSLEITFYGTGLNLLMLFGNTAGAAPNLFYQIDGGAPTALIHPTTSQYLGPTNTNIAMNNIQPVISGLSAGIHTITITNTVTTAWTWNVYGFEVINTRTTPSNVGVNPGISYVNGQQLTLGAHFNTPYNSSFTNSYGTPGAKGGRVLVYQNSTGTIAKDIRYADVTQGNLGSATHANEELVRSYNYAEFGSAGPVTNSYDFLFAGHSATPRAYVLSDNSTILSASDPTIVTNGNFERSLGCTAANSFIVFTFIGTGLDIVRYDPGTTGTTAIDTFNVYVDGTLTGTITGVSYRGVTPIVSGLPYGTHTVKFVRTVLSSISIGIMDFNVYQPKTPSLPAGAVALSTYNLVATYDSSSVTDNTAATGYLENPSGVIYKDVLREWHYDGSAWNAWTQSSSPMVTTTNGLLSGQQTTTGATTNEPASYTFYGTGCMVIWDCSSGGTFGTLVQIDGVNATTGVNKGNMVNSGAGVYTTTSSTSWAPGRVEFTGLTLGIHTITLQKTAGAGNFALVGINVITPIHSVSSIQPGTLQNNLPVGANAIQDVRNLTPVKNLPLKTKAWAQATGALNGGTVAAAAVTIAPDMSLTVTTSGGPLFVSWNFSFLNDTAGAQCNVAIIINGLNFGGPYAQSASVPVANDIVNMSGSFIEPVGAGTYTITMYLSIPTGVTTLNGTRRSLAAQEI